MDPLTHAGLGALSARTAGGRGWCLGAGVAGGLAPDSDYLLFLFDPLLFHTDWHRSFTHSLIMLPLWGLLITGILYLLSRRRQPWWPLYLCACLGLASHIVADLLTAWDLQLLWPASEWRTSLAWTYVIDPWFTTLLFIGLLLSLGWRPAAFITWVALALWLGWLVLNKQEARQQALDFAAGLNTPARVEAWPQPFSPRNWKLVVTTHEGHWQAHVHLGQRQSPLAHLWPHPWLRQAALSYRPLAQLDWRYHSRFSSHRNDGSEARQLWYSDTMADFRHFARYPVRYLPAPATPGCLWFTDLLYVIPTQRPPFIYGACRGPDGHWQQARQPILLLEDFRVQRRHGNP